MQKSRAVVSAFSFSCFVLVSDFGFRISNFCAARDRLLEGKELERALIHLQFEVIDFGVLFFQSGGQLPVP
jgi:hypothetical protein